jgi:hypothetical protein
MRVKLQVDANVHPSHQHGKQWVMQSSVMVNRDHAISLIGQVQEWYDAHLRNIRQYPESIVNRILGIMVDDAVTSTVGETGRMPLCSGARD